MEICCTGIPSDCCTKADVLDLISEPFQIELTTISVCPCPKGELFLDIGAKRPAIGGCKC